MMTRGRPVSGPASWLLRDSKLGAFPGANSLGADGRAGQGSRANLVEARAAVDGPVVARRERYDGLTPAGPADRGMELARAFAGAGSLGSGTARWASLGVVGQPLRGEECLLAGREEELLGAVATGQTTVLVHPRQTLLGSDAMTVEPTGRAGDGSATGERGGGATPGRPGLGPGTHSGEDTRAVKSPTAESCWNTKEPMSAFRGWTWVPGRVERYRSAARRHWRRSIASMPRATNRATQSTNAKFERNVVSGVMLRRTQGCLDEDAHNQPTMAARPTFSEGMSSSPEAPRTKSLDGEERANAEQAHRQPNQDVLSEHLKRRVQDRAAAEAPRITTMPAPANMACRTVTDRRMASYLIVRSIVKGADHSNCHHTQRRLLPGHGATSICKSPGQKPYELTYEAAIAAAIAAATQTTGPPARQRTAAIPAAPPAASAP